MKEMQGGGASPCLARVQGSLELLPPRPRTMTGKCMPGGAEGHHCISVHRDTAGCRVQGLLKARHFHALGTFISWQVKRSGKASTRPGSRERGCCCREAVMIWCA